MSKEIERKFAVSDPAVVNGHVGLHIVQGYIADEPMTVRVRLMEAEAFLTLKGKAQGIERDEYEFPIPVSHARELLERYCGDRVIEKIRYRIPHKGQVFEVDVFQGRLDGLVVAELELDSVDQAVELPAWVGVELSGDHRYSNSSLSVMAAPPELEGEPERPTGVVVSLEAARRWRQDHA